MASTLTSLTLSSTPTILAKSSNPSKPQPTIFSQLNQPWKKRCSRIMASKPDLSEKVVESIKAAEEKCGEDPVSGECVAAWDEVEELSAAVSHEKAKNKGADPLEEFCKDNMETDECRTYED